MLFFYYPSDLRIPKHGNLKKTGKKPEKSALSHKKTFSAKNYPPRQQSVIQQHFPTYVNS